MRKVLQAIIMDEEREQSTIMDEEREQSTIMDEETASYYNG